jgi:hypothetical protein
MQCGCEISSGVDGNRFSRERIYRDVDEHLSMSVKPSNICFDRVVEEEEKFGGVIWKLL